MNSKGAFWVRIWAIVASVVIMLSAMLIANNAIEVSAVQMTIERGANPLDASCAIYGIDSDKLCVLRMENR